MIKVDVKILPIDDTAPSVDLSICKDYVINVDTSIPHSQLANVAKDVIALKVPMEYPSDYDIIVSHDGITLEDDFSIESYSMDQYGQLAA